MPGLDGTGPLGLGPMTGRGLGLCRGYGFRPFGRGFGRGLGLGRGYAWRARALAYQPVYPATYQPLTKEEEKAEIQAEIKDIERYLEELKKRLKELE